MTGGRVPGRAAVLVATALLAVGCGGGQAEPTMSSVLEAVPLRVTGGQTVDVQLGVRQPSDACHPLPGGEQVRVEDGDLTVSVPVVAPTLPRGTVRVVPRTPSSYVVGPSGTATAWADRTLAQGDEGDVAAFVGVGLGRTSPVGAVPAVTWLARALDDAGAYAAVIRGPATPPDLPGGIWTARAATRDGRLMRVSAGAEGVRDRQLQPSTDPCAYRR